MKPTPNTLGFILSYGALNSIANLGVLLPYLFILLAYNQLHSTALLIGLLTIYTTRAVSFFGGLHLRLKSSQYLLLNLLCGLLGALIYMIAPSTTLWLIIGGLPLGYSAATLWPYFLTIKLHATTYGTFAPKPYHWFIFLLSLGGVIGIDLLHPILHLAFGALAILYAAALPSAIRLVYNLAPVYQQADLHADQRPRMWRLVPLLFFAGIIASLALARKQSVGGYLYPLLIALILIAFVMTLRELLLDTKLLADIDIRLVFRGFLLNFVLFYATFYGGLFWGTHAPLVIFSTYLIGFQIGPRLPKWFPVLIDHRQLLDRWWPLSATLLIILNQPWTFVLGILLLSLYVGFLNPYFNNDLYFKSGLSKDVALFYKYRLSAYGSQLFQLCFFALLLTFGVTQHFSIIMFFKLTPTLATALHHSTIGPLNDLIDGLLLIGWGVANWRLRRSSSTK
ncbi:hypothetical protein ACRYI5_04165 [Furfurilactobacillus sp. WILCCON 0119]